MYICTYINDSTYDADISAVGGGVSTRRDHGVYI